MVGLRNLDSWAKNTSMCAGASHEIASYSCVITWHRPRDKAGCGPWSSEGDGAGPPHWAMLASG